MEQNLISRIYRHDYEGHEISTRAMKANPGSKALVTDPGGGIFDPHRSLCRWKDEFLSRRSICLDEENRSFFEAVRNPNEDEDIMDVLSGAYEVEYDRWAYKMEPLQRLCAGLKLDLFTSTTLEREAPVALVFDRDGSGRRPLRHGPLTAGGLYRVLCRQRFGVAMDPLATEQEECDISDALPIPCAVQAEQRIIYLTDPDARSLSVLAATASLPQALPLLEFMAERLSSNPSFSIRVPPKGVAVFEMSFQLPFLVFRSVPSDDESRGPLEGRSSCTNLSFLTFNSDFDGQSGETESHFLCQSTFSCFVHGWDFARWTAYGLFDTYFDKTDCRECATQYIEDSKASNPYFAGDPLTYAQEDLNRPITCPRHYFLRVLQTRIIRVGDEWGKVVSEVLEMVGIGEVFFWRTQFLEGSISLGRGSMFSLSKQVTRLTVSLQQARCQVAFQPFRPDTTNTDMLLTAIDERQVKLTQAYQWNIRARSLLIRLKRLLEKTVKSWQSFVSKDIEYLYQEGSHANVGPGAIQTLHSIKRVVDELESLHDELHHQVEVFEKGCMQEYEQHSRDARLTCGPVSYVPSWTGRKNGTGAAENSAGSAGNV
ncbi:uncharacterized protein PG986_009432 [Apiospora aurea]|uniref:Uncharacterized protein n=1 Tax=Apiospora aurea TaxID=335848 RepID=A0ABR1Q7N0_9PEZI